MIRTPALALVLIASFALAPGTALGSADLREEIEFVGFSSKEKVFCVRVIDPNRGNYFSVRKTRTGKKVKDHPYHEENEKRVLKRVLRSHDIDDEGIPNAASPDGSITLVGTQKGSQFEVLALASEGRGVDGDGRTKPPQNRRKREQARRCCDALACDRAARSAT